MQRTRNAKKSRWQSFSDSINKPMKIQWSPKERADAKKKPNDGGSGGIVKQITNISIFKGLLK